jgi:DNA-binding MarR family transcriptional regulator
MRDNECTVSEIAHALKLPRTTIGRNTKLLVEKDLMEKRVAGNCRFLRVAERAKIAMTKISERPETAREKVPALAKELNLDFWVVMTPEEQRKKELARLKRARVEHPERFRKNIINSLKRRVSKPDFFAVQTRESMHAFRKLTRMLFDDCLPKECARCGSRTCLHIHHKVYEYPLQIDDLERLCRPCHDALHHWGADTSA